MKKKILKIFWIIFDLFFVFLCFSAVGSYFPDYEILSKQNPENTAHVLFLGFVCWMLTSFFFSKIANFVLFIWDKIKNRGKVEKITEEL